MSRAVVYCRVSTEQQAGEGTSLVSQDSRCRQYATEQGYQIIATFSDTASGAAYRDRPGLSRMRELVRAKSVDVIVAYAIDRLSRNQAHLAILAEEANDHGARLEFVTEDFEDSAVGRFIRSAHAFAAEVEREKIVERSVRGKRARIESGKLHRHGPELYGYVRDHDLNQRVVVESQAAVIRLMYSWVAGGSSIKAVRNRLNAERVPSPSGNPVSRWSLSQVSRMLRDPTYKGETHLWRYKSLGRKRNTAPRPESERVRLDALTPPIVSRETWDAAQRQMDANRGERTRNERRPQLLRGLIWCSVCGRRCYPDSEHGRRVYRCSSRMTPAGPCGASRIPADTVEAEVWVDIIKQLRTERPPRTHRIAPDAQNEVSTLNRRLAAIQRAQDRLIARVAQSDVITWEHVESQIKQGDAERQAIAERLAEIERKQSDQDVAAKRDRTMRDLIRAAGKLETANWDRRRWVLETLGIRIAASGADWSFMAGDVGV